MDNLSIERIIALASVFFLLFISSGAIAAENGECQAELAGIYKEIVEDQARGDIDAFLKKSGGTGRALLEMRLNERPELRSGLIDSWREEAEYAQRFRVSDMYVSPNCLTGILVLVPKSSRGANETSPMPIAGEVIFANHGDWKMILRLWKF
ncbi:hypothetical protein [Thiohalomonas denitrificans]|uniref:DUF4440 domain-containing protein n=1 Tax=Thiohalomonas denitrificans TaxID=415747 RepID=A0A1G5PUR2_9GAMM|nr:hypothetical protein [Thiohalomonas denitrificans]SCZ53172.1 hypothetical protein SAMN03097708_00881 [Thiohalomonas denitrificans]